MHLITHLLIGTIDAVIGCSVVKLISLQLLSLFETLFQDKTRLILKVFIPLVSVNIGDHATSGHTHRSTESPVVRFVQCCQYSY